MLYLCKNPATRRFHNSLMSSRGKYLKKNCCNFIELYLIELLLWGFFLVFLCVFFFSTVFFKNYNGGIQLLLIHLYIFHIHSFYIHIKRNLLIQQLQSDTIYGMILPVLSMKPCNLMSQLSSFWELSFLKSLCSYFVCEHKESREPTAHSSLRNPRIVYSHF